jgi:hypothetical protein
VEEVAVAIQTTDAEALGANGARGAFGGVDTAVGAERRRKWWRRIGQGSNRRGVEVIDGGEVEIVEVRRVVGGAAAEIIEGAVAGMQGGGIDDDGVVNTAGARSAEVGREKH